MSLEILNNPLLGKNGVSFFENPDPYAPSFPVQKSPPELKQLTAKQIADTYYGGKPVAQGKGFEIYSDDPVLRGEIEEVTIYRSRFAQTIGGIDVVVFAHKSGAFLLQRYMEAIPQSNELILFLEIDDSFNYNTVFRSVAGSNLTQKKDFPFAEILSFARKHEVTVSPDQLKKLIQEGIYRNKVSFISWFLGLKDASVGKIFNFFTKTIFRQAEKFFSNIGEGISGLKMDEYEWNPSPKEGAYDPAFIPEVLYKELKKFYEHEASKNPYENLDGQKKVNTKIVKTLFDRINEVQSHFQDLVKAAETFFPAYIYKKMNQALNTFFKQIDKIEGYLVDPMTGMQHVIYKSYQVANAFLCGIYNSIIDIIAGIFSLIGFVFRAVSEMQNISDNRAEYGEMFLELMEDLIEGIVKFDYAGFLYQSITFQMKTVTRLVRWIENAVPGVTIEKAAYYYGYVVGILIDIIVETLLTGGAAAVARLAKSVESFMLNPLQKIAQGIEKTINFTKDLLTRVLEFIQMLLREFKKGVENVFAKLEKILNEVFGFGEEVADNALTPAEKRVKNKKKEHARRLEERQNRLNRKLIYRKYASKFEKGFFNHLEGEFNIKTFTSRTGINKSEALVSQGGHSSEAIGKSLKLKGNPIPDPIIDDLPYKSKIEVKYRDGFIEKEAMSSMFPKNWNMKRIQEEVAHVYENTVAKGANQMKKKSTDLFNKYVGESTNGFDILIEVDDLGNIMNAYPYLK